MSALFILNNSKNVVACQQAMSASDRLLLIEDGVLAVTSLENHTYALEEDLLARGLLESFKNYPNIEIIDYSAFVELTLKFDKTVTWL